jgi:hypothetical protein
MREHTFLHLRYDQVEKAEVALVEALRIKRQGLKKEGAEENDDSDVATTLEALALAYTKQGDHHPPLSFHQRKSTKFASPRARSYVGQTTQANWRRPKTCMSR